jgi:hypothetical protein
MPSLFVVELVSGRSDKPHLIDDETVAKMGHPIVAVRSDVGHPTKSKSLPTLAIWARRA